jgi:hypothetical protein
MIFLKSAKSFCVLWQILQYGHATVPIRCPLPVPIQSDVLTLSVGEGGRGIIFPDGLKNQSVYGKQH